MDERRSGMNVEELITKLAKERDMWKEKAMNMVEKSTFNEVRDRLAEVNQQPTVKAEAYNIAWQKVEEIQKKYDALRETYAILFDTHQVEVDKDKIWKERYDAEVINAEFWKNTYYENVGIKGKVYVFSDIPNDCDGQRFTDDLKKYLNKESYKMRVRGQYLKDEVKETEGWKKYEYGQPIEQSKCLRVYIDKK